MASKVRQSLNKILKTFNSVVDAYKGNEGAFKHITTKISCDLERHDETEKYDTEPLAKQAAREISKMIGYERYVRPLLKNLKGIEIVVVGLNPQYMPLPAQILIPLRYNPTSSTLYILVEDLENPEVAKGYIVMATVQAYDQSNNQLLSYLPQHRNLMHTKALTVLGLTGNHATLEVLKDRLSRYEKNLGDIIMQQYGPQIRKVEEICQDSIKYGNLEKLCNSARESIDTFRKTAQKAIKEQKKGLQFAESVISSAENKKLDKILDSRSMDDLIRISESKK